MATITHHSQALLVQLELQLLVLQDQLTLSLPLLLALQDRPTINPHLVQLQDQLTLSLQLLLAQEDLAAELQQAAADALVNSI